VPQPMPWPIMGSAALFSMALGAVFLFNGAPAGWIGIAAGFALLAADTVTTPKEGIALAASALDDGRARRKLDQWAAFTRGA